MLIMLKLKKNKGDGKKDEEKQAYPMRLIGYDLVDLYMLFKVPEAEEEDKGEKFFKIYW